MSSAFLDTWTRLAEIERSIENDLTSAGLDLKPIEAYILKELYADDRQHASALARLLGRAATSFTPILDKIENKGYICRKSDKSDRRAVFICLTDEGKQIETTLMNTISAVEKKLGKK